MARRMLKRAGMWTLTSIAIRNLLRNKRRTLITLAALLVGVGATITIRGLLNGLQLGIIRATVESSTGALQVHRTGYLKNVLAAPLSLDFEADDALLNRIRHVPGVRAVAPRIQFGGSLTVTPSDGSEASEALFFTATAVDPKAELLACRGRARIFGSDSRFDDDHVLLGETLTKSLHATSNDEVVMLAPDHDGALSGELSHVGGSLKSLMPGEPKVALVPLRLAQKLLHMAHRATELVVGIDDLNQLDSVVSAVRAELGPTFEVHRWDDVATDRKAGMMRQNVLAAVIAGAFMILMLLGVANTTLMSVLERTREIGTMLAMGITRGQVLTLFLVEALTLGLVGGALGALAGTGLTVWLATKNMTLTPPSASVSIDVVPFLAADTVIGVMLVATVGAVLFALYPSFRASRLRPVEALAGR